ncbi:MAG TPA: NAD(P)/FAD-dependent oxidoreductase [Acidimicrobiia bacterium]|nr:NAD(P)/FAD-dependent oxidoreductase [Acidimicrobiia bacterium]
MGTGGLTPGGELDAVVIGSGPNGLAAAITVAQHGGSVLVVEAADTVGGGLRSFELTGPGLLHDVCSTIHSLGAGSPFMRSLPLEQYGLEWVQPDVLLAHPLGPDRAALLHRSLDDTAKGLGQDGEKYRRLIGPVFDMWDQIEHSVLGPIISWPDHPIALIRFGLRALLPASMLGRWFDTEEAAALFTGCSAHAFIPLTRVLTSAFGLMLTSFGHRYGWPFARGGSKSMADALVAHLASLGGRIETGRHITDLGELPRSRVILADVTPGSLAGLLEGRVPDEFLRRYRRFRHGPAAFKVDYALTEPVPWTNPDLSRAGTIHLGGTAPAIIAAESATWAGRPAARPFTLVCQPTQFDPTRSTDGRHSLWAYAHVPNGSDADHLSAIERLITELAPGFPDVIADRSVLPPAELEKLNPNLVGGDIAGGASTLSQLVFRPVPRLDPYTTPLDRVFLCSASTPPGGGTHGMSGHLAAQSAIQRWL